MSMIFSTKVDIPKSGVVIDHSTRMMLFGSCFSESIGEKLSRSKFHTDRNPFGILYNPFSVSSAIRRLFLRASFTESDLIFDNGLYHSLMHHGSFSDPDLALCLNKIAERFDTAVKNIEMTDLFLITFGSAYVYKWRESGEITGNCHKLPSVRFHRYRLTVEEIVEEWQALITMLTNSRPDVMLLFTVSPVRHWKDGAHENQISKSVLHLAIDRLQRDFPENVRYFPAYEVMIDELRDYRYYNEDMMHPSSLAIDYIWQLFGNAFFSSETKEINEEWEQIRKAMEHRPLHPGTKSHTLFNEDTFRRLKRFSEKYPHISCESEINTITDLIKTDSPVSLKVITSESSESNN